MTTVAEIYDAAERFINQLLRKESADQGHTLTGAMEDSFTSEHRSSGRKEVMEGFAVHYTRYVNDGFPGASASMKQFPFLVEYFKARGVRGENDREAKAAAAATIKVWMREGMSTQASKRFSKTGSRQNMIENAFEGNSSRIEEFMSNSFDHVVEEQFQRNKSETI